MVNKTHQNRVAKYSNVSDTIFKRLKKANYEEISAIKVTFNYQLSLFGIAFFEIELQASNQVNEKQHYQNLGDKLFSIIEGVKGPEGFSIRINDADLNLYRNEKFLLPTDSFEYKLAQNRRFITGNHELSLKLYNISITELFEYVNSISYGGDILLKYELRVRSGPS